MDSGSSAPLFLEFHPENSGVRRLNLRKRAKVDAWTFGVWTRGARRDSMTPWGPDQASSPGVRVSAKCLNESPKK